MKSWTKFTLIITLIITSTLFHTIQGQTLTADGVTYEIEYTGGAETFTIPDAASLNGNTAIKFFAKGGDGGKHRSSSTNKSKGGGGASAEGTFAIGTGANELKPGARIRFVVGQRGENQVRKSGVVGAGGAGGTAVLYTEADDADITCLRASTSLDDAATCWVALMIAGGGSGAYGSGFASTRGKNGRAEECGNDGDGSEGGNGGCAGSGGSGPNLSAGTKRAGGGGGIFTKGQNGNSSESGRAGGFEGDRGGIQGLGGKNITGGFGFGGGGAGSLGGLKARAGSGGGGGYSGGGGGDTARGGGGGSYMSSAAIFPDKRDGNADGSPDNGKITYTFEASIGGAQAVCKDIEVTLNGGIAVLTPELIDDGSTANEGFFLRFEIDGNLQEVFPVSCNHLGQNTVSLVVVTASGFTNKCTSVIDVLDDTAPTITCNTTPITASVSFGEPFILDPTTILTSFFDGCGTLTELYAEQDVFTCEHLGTQIVTIVAEDESANEGTCDLSVTITEGSVNSFSLSCPSDVTVDIANVSACPAIALEEDLAPTLTGPCVFELSYEVSNTDGSVYQSGSGLMPNTSFAFETNTVTYTFGENLLINPPTCSFTVSLSGSFMEDQPFICLDDVNHDLFPDEDCELFLPSNFYKTFFFACYDDAEVIFEYTDVDGQVTSEGPFDGFNPPDRSFGIGVTEVTFNMYVGSLVQSCSFFVNVNDATPPAAVCKDLTIDVGNNCQATFPASDFDNGSSEDCGTYAFLKPGSTSVTGSGLVITIPPSSTFTLTGTGEQTVTVLVVDESGNESNCTPTVTINDNTPPEAVCPESFSINLSESLLTGANLGAGSSDNCTSTENLTFFMLATDVGGAPLGETYNIGCSELGDFNITLQVTDESGNSSTCNVTVDVNDDIAPTVSCSDATISLDANGEASANAFLLVSGSGDNCDGAVTVSLDGGSIADFDCSNIGDNDVVVVATDEAGNTANCTATVTIQDNTVPVLNCINTTIQLDGDKDHTITEENVLDGGVDNCGTINFVSASPSELDCDDVGGPVSLTVTADDGNGNISTCIAMVTVQDIDDPEPVCKDNTVSLDASGEYSLTENDVLDGGFDNCGTVNFDYTNVGKVSCSDIGTTVAVIVYVNDGNGNTATCISNITVEDNEMPVLNCKTTTVQLDANGEYTLLESDVFESGTDNCGIISFVSASPNMVNCDDVGNTIDVTVTTDNGFGTMATCMASITIEDNTAPNAQCQNITVQLDDDGVAIITVDDIDNGSNDACGDVDLILGSDTFFCNQLGSDNNVTLTVTDESGNVSSCISQVTVEDSTLPTAICKDVTINIENDPTLISTDDINNGSFDNCNITNLSLDRTSFGCADVGQMIDVILAISDGTNSNTCIGTVTVIDNTAPIAVCGMGIVTLDENGEGTLMAEDLDGISGFGVSSDACGPLLFSFDQAGLVTSLDYTCADLGQPDITLYVSDPSGNTSSCTTTVLIEDQFVPDMICVSSLTIGLSESTLYATQLDAGSTDNCATDLNLEMILDLGITGNPIEDYVLLGANYDLSCDDIGELSVLLIGHDGEAGSSFCETTVTVIDDVAPVVQCQDITIQLDGTGNANLSENQVDNNSFDVCGSISFSLDQSNFDCTNLGAPVSVTLTVTDEYNNANTCTTEVTVEDNIAPTAVCQDITIQLDENGKVSIIASQIDEGSNDNCAITDYALDISDFTCQNIGDNPVTLTVSDASGNGSSCTAQVSVEDLLLPKVSCQDITVELDANGEASITPSQIDNGSTDNCGIGNLSLDITQFDCGHVGNQTVTLTVTDANGNADNCTAMVAVEDNIVPTIICQDITVELNENGEHILSNGQLEVEKTDNCAVSNLGSVVPSLMTCEDVGQPVPVVVTRLDVNGNEGTCNANVTVIDNTAPVPNCINMDIDLDGSPSYVLQEMDVLNGGTDNCGMVNFVSASPAEIFCDELGSTIDVLVTVNDGNGNEADCIAQVTVVGLPCDWIDDGGIGCTETSSSYDYTNGVFTLTSENCTPAYPYTNDQMAFVSQELCGDGEIIALVTDVDGNGYGGVMIRESNDPSSPKMAFSTDHVNKLLKEVRLVDGYPAWPQQLYSIDKFWLRIERKGLLFRAYASVDGVVWIPYIFQYMQMDACVNIGLFTYSNVANTTVTSTFESVSITNSGTNSLSSLPNNVLQSEINEVPLDVNIYPNPAVDELNINLSNFIDQEINIQLYNNLGQLVISQRIEQVADAIQRLDVSTLEAGSFILNIQVGDQQISKRVMILND